MSIEELGRLLKIIRGFFPSFVINEDVAEAWYSVLEDYTYEEVKENVKEYAKTNRFAPTVSDIIPQTTQGWGQ